MRIYTEKPLEVIDRFTSVSTVEEDYRYLDLAKCVTPPNTDAYNNIYEKSQEEISDDPTFWYNWNRVNWGTKWNTYACKYEWIDTSSGGTQSFVEFDFETAWSPPHPAIKAMVEIIQNEIDSEVIVAHYFLDEGYYYEGTTIYTEQGIGEKIWEPTEKDEEGYITSWSDAKIREFLSLR